MTAVTFRNPTQTRFRRILSLSGTVAGAVRKRLPGLRAHAAPAVSQLREHAFSILGFGFIDSACFTHSLFTGLMVTGVSWFVFEWKVAD